MTEFARAFERMIQQRSVLGASSRAPTDLVEDVRRGKAAALFKHRRFLFLQGVASPFFARLADRLVAEGAGIHRLNFCAGDLLYWGTRPAWSWRGETEALAGFLEERFAEHAFTDLVLFGDQRPLHRIGIEVARRRGAGIHVYEEGYWRPNWVTLERDGVNGASRLPRDPQWYHRVYAALPAVGEERPVRSDLRVRAAHDMAYHLANLGNPALFPRYRTHRPQVASVEYAGWSRRFARFPWQRRRDAALIAALDRRKTPYYLLPLQLNADYQIIRHSSFQDMPDLIEHVARSFAAHAPGSAHLLIKNHPLDTGLVDYSGQLARLSRELDLVGRLHFIETGHLPTLLERALGTVTVNSTAGLVAIAQGNPTCALGRAIYDLPGLTHQEGLDRFWSDARPPDHELFQAFRAVVIHTTQVNGDFYTGSGIRLAVENSLYRLRGRLSPLAEWMVAIGGDTG